MMNDTPPCIGRSAPSLKKGLGLLLALALGAGPAGCVVIQRPGNGQLLHIQEPMTRAWFWLYLPPDYASAALDPAPRFPLVMTFHGMKPFDNANPQAREWQQEADRYGYVVCAPELLTPDLTREFPIRRVTPAMARDERAVVAIMDYVTTHAHVDPNAVLSTSWSSGGYIAHYMMNRHPERFSCLAVRQSNFSSAVLDERQAPRYRDRRVAIFYNENDFAICKLESREAAEWYARHGFDVTFAEFMDHWHDRLPGPAAEFFAGTCGAEAKTPPLEVARLRVREIPRGRVAERIAAGPSGGGAAAGGGGMFGQDGSTLLPADAAALAPGEPHDAPALQAAATRGAAALRTRPLPPTTDAPPPAHHDQPVPVGSAPPVPRSPIRVMVSSTIGIAPLLVSFHATVPASIAQRAYYLWTDNGEPICNGGNGQKFLMAPGDHEIEVLVSTTDGKEYRASQTVTVLERITGQGR